MNGDSRKSACFEVSWEVANAVGGIHTVLASKAEQMRRIYGDRYIVIGPWVRDARQDSVWEDEALAPARALAGLASLGISVRTGRWKVPGKPHGILIDFTALWEKKNRLLEEYWERFGLDSLSGGRDYEEPALFGIAAGLLVERLTREWLEPSGSDVVLHAHEWLTASAILHLKHACPKVACVFTTHATALGRSLASRAHLPESPLTSEQSARLAAECGVSAKHSMEVVAARVADAFTTVSETTARECEIILGTQPAVVLPNALQENYPPESLRGSSARKRARQTLLELARQTTGVDYALDGPTAPLILITSGRYEFRNKGLDLFTEALAQAQLAMGPNPPGSMDTKAPKVLAFYLVPADSTDEVPTGSRDSRRMTHALRHSDGDPLLAAFDQSGLRNEARSAVHVVYVPKFLDGSDRRVPQPYFEVLAGADMTFFPSWYEPWGYTPMESVALGIPTVTTDLTGYSQWATAFGGPEQTGVFQIRRTRRNHREVVTELADLIIATSRKGREALARFEKPCLALARKGLWNDGSPAIAAYLEAHRHAREAASAKQARLEAPANLDSAYFSMEFGIKPDLQIYSGGLGVLAGDFLKGAQDLNYQVCGLSLAYREGYFQQRISDSLTQEVWPAPQVSFERTGLKHVLDAQGRPLIFEVPLPDGRQILSAAWRLEMDSSQLLLLDTDIEENPADLRGLARRLYTSDRRERWLQEYFLGIGGIRLLEILDLRPRCFQMNEGHTALLAFERIAQAMRDRYLNFEEALTELRGSTLFTTHTPVPAGHEEFARETCRPELEMIASRLRVHPDRIQALGRSQKHGSDCFSLTALALAISSKVNAVSKRHRVAAERSFDGQSLESKHLFSVTNGVHPQTWVCPAWQSRFASVIGPDWTRRLAADGDVKTWARILELEDRAIWDCHREARRGLEQRLRQRLTSDELASSRRGSAHSVLKKLDEEPMIGVFARRFTAYKRPGLLFSDPSRIASLIRRYPKTLLLFAGKAHPADGMGQDLIHRVLELERSPEFQGHVLFLEDYGIADAQLLVSGADIWINLPQQPLEASGTSGMKAAMNGVLNLSVSDGWVPEADYGEVPWRIGMGTETFGKSAMDWIHARELYAFLELEVLPEYWNRGADGVPSAWVARMKRSIAHAVPRFSAQRMVREYAEQTKWGER